ncbi:MAG: hypothetical protein IJY67_01310 [Paludibacteraceae bacterium]|nr:hypothetical protein [Paludibacteraceae bacterium]
MNFIQNLLKKRSCYAHPDQATTQARSLEQLSSGIYTEDERFVFELLQNAVDAFSDENSLLDIKIVVQDNYLVFMHNGEEFSERDIEGLCDVGNGNKTKDIKKIGYKGIGFKSVFRASSLVYVESGKYCFKFDKKEWDGYWDRPNMWKSEYGDKYADKQYLMPWQIIPKETDAPIQIDKKGYNVITYIHANNIVEISKSVLKLMQTSQFLLFLKISNVKMTFSDIKGNLQVIEKQTIENEIVLSVNGKEESRWLYIIYPEVEVPNELREKIVQDQKTPDKLIVEEKGKRLSVKSFDLSFAICIESKDDKIFAKKAENPVMYTYLPTSFKFGDSGFPFLVNANFITDAGREHLIKDSEWNKLIISRIPELYLSWVASFSSKIENYYEVLPDKSYGVSDYLLSSYKDAFELAIEKIAFIPSKKSEKLLKATESIIDKIGISEVISYKMLFEHVNKTYHKDFKTADCFIENRGISILKSYGVFIFDNNKFKNFFDDEDAIKGITIDADVKLIDLLYSYCKFEDNNGDFEYQLKEVSFLLNNKNVLSVPQKLCTTSIVSANDLNSDVDILHPEIFQKLSEETIGWLKSLGLSEPSDTSIIDKRKLFEDGYVTVDNAVEIGRFIFELHKKAKLTKKHYAQLQELLFLTKSGSLKYATELYLSDVFKPDILLEKYISEDEFFISSKYLLSIESVEQWKLFLSEIGVKSTIGLTYVRWEENVNLDYLDLKKTWEESKKKREFGYFFTPRWYLIEYYPFISISEDNYVLSKVIWSYLLNKEYDIQDNSKIRGHIGDYWKFNGYDNSREPTLFSLGIESFRKIILSRYQKFPSTTKEMLLAKNIYMNTPYNIDICSNYLPIIDVNCHIHESWLDVLPLKRDLSLDDLLLLLTCISNDLFNKEENKDRILKIYKRIIEQRYIVDFYSKEKIKQWATLNKIFSQDGYFYSPSELSYTTLEGFTSKRQVYTGRIEDKEKLIELLKLFGVRIITIENIESKIEGKNIDNKLKDKLLSLVPFIALLASDNQGKEFYISKKVELQKLVEQTTFYSCEFIELLIKNSDIGLFKQTFAEGSNFYYVGDLKPTKIEPLLFPICSYLGLVHKERELFSILIESDYNDILDFLAEKEYETEWIDMQELLEINQNRDIVQVGVNLNNDLSKMKQIEANYKAKEIVLSHLEQKGFDISNVDSTQSVVIGVKKDGVTYPLVVKNCENYENRININPNEWRELFKPNSMLWLHFGGGVVAPIKVFELFTYQDKLTLSFDTVNLMMDERVDKIMDVMRYFNNVHLDLVSLVPNQSRAEAIDDYCFNVNNADNSDLDTDSLID